MGSHVLGALTVTVAGDARERWLGFAGRLDETARLAGHALAWAARTVVLDSAGIVFINSIGIREWMQLVAALGAAGATLIHDRCSELLVEQMCFIPAVRGPGEVRSFHAPYQCARCGAEASVLLELAHHRTALAAMQAPPVACVRCASPMELADVPERLFAFLRAD